MAIAVHEPVLVRELLELLAPKPNGVYVDGTLGGGGHAEAFLQALGPKGFLIGLDRDAEVLKIARERLKFFEKQVVILQANFKDIKTVLREAGYGNKVDGIYLDLGVSSFQLDTAGRGFSFSKEGPIDMRMNPLENENVLEKIRKSNERELAQVLENFGEERYAAKIARIILEKMKRNELHSTLDVANVAFETYPTKTRYKRPHPATRTFQALRIWVNEELDCLNFFLEQAPHLLKVEGHLCIISYHSLEDRIVKHAFRKLCKMENCFGILTKKPIISSEEEVLRNPRARSAKLRGLKRIQ